jgi:CheY-like chemotaxis protein
MREICVDRFCLERASGCDDYVTKPYIPADLLRLVRRYLGETAQR